jgi:hypothetical protein
MKNTFQQLSKFTKTLLIAGLVFIIYGYLCRLANLYFFWESKSIGWTLLFIGIIGLLLNKIKIKTTENKKSIPEKIGIGLIAFILFIQTILIAVIPFTDAYSIAKISLASDQKLKSEIGNITGFGIIPTGAIQKTTDSNGEYGNATINLTVKGDKKFKDVTINVAKYADSPEWKVEGVE